jgi:hypothetical protein
MEDRGYLPGEDCCPPQNLMMTILYLEDTIVIPSMSLYIIKII